MRRKLGDEPDVADEPWRTTLRPDSSMVLTAPDVLEVVLVDSDAPDRAGQQVILRNVDGRWTVLGTSPWAI